ncbi:MAG: RNA polymerase sigma factor [bacterium]
MEPTNESIKPLHNHCCEPTVFEHLFQKHGKAINDFLIYKYGSNFEVEDKVQEAFITLWKNCKNVLPEKAKSYLFTVANNLVLNEIKHQKVVFKFKEHKVKQVTNESPEFVLQEKEFEQKLSNALATLSEAQRTAFLMNRIEGKKHKEIAEILGISTKAVEKRIYGALSKLREQIKEL